MHENKTNFHTSSLRVIPLCCLSENSHAPRIWAFQQRPSIRRSQSLDVASGKRSSPLQKLLKRLISCLQCLYDDVRPSLYIQRQNFLPINCKMEISKEGRNEQNTFEQVECSQLLAHNTSSKQISFQTYQTLSKHEIY